jgi:hypothetical protein
MELAKFLDRVTATGAEDFPYDSASLVVKSKAGIS